MTQSWCRLLQSKRSVAVAQTTRTVERWECDVREYECRFGKALEEDGKIGVILALALLSAQNHCHLNSQREKLHSVQDDVLRLLSVTDDSENGPMDLSMLDKGKKGKGDKKGNGKNGKGKGGGRQGRQGRQGHQRQRQRQSD